MTSMIRLMKYFMAPFIKIQFFFIYSACRIYYSSNALLFIFTAICNSKSGSAACHLTYDIYHVIYRDGSVQYNSGGHCVRPEVCDDCNDGFYSIGPVCLCKLNDDSTLNDLLSNYFCVLVPCHKQTILDLSVLLVVDSNRYNNESGRCSFPLLSAIRPPVT